MAYREEVIGPHRLILGDCLEIMHNLAPVAHVICDPPFSLRTHAGHDGISANIARDGSARKSLGYAGLSDEDARIMAQAFCDKSLGWVVWFTDHTLAPIVYRAFSDRSRATFPPLPFFQPGRSVRLSGDGPSSWTDWIVCCRTKELHKWGTLPGGYVAGEGWKDKTHMGGKPLQLMQMVVRDYSRYGETVLDPCMGGATTLVACESMGRRGIGIELDPVTFDKACRRVEAAMRQPRLDLEPPPKAEQIGMDL